MPLPEWFAFSMNLSAYDIECLEQAKALIDQDRRMHRSTAEIAQAVCMGATRLKAGFKAYYGMGLYSYLREQRMQLALHLLESSDKTIKAIAHETGFLYITNFSAAFKKRFGTSAGNYRRLQQKSV